MIAEDIPQLVVEITLLTEGALNLDSGFEIYSVYWALVCTIMNLVKNLVMLCVGSQSAWSGSQAGKTDAATAGAAIELAAVAPAAVAPAALV